MRIGVAERGGDGQALVSFDDPPYRLAAGGIGVCRHGADEPPRPAVWLPGPGGAFATAIERGRLRLELAIVRSDGGPLVTGAVANAGDRPLPLGRCRLRLLPEVSGADSTGWSFLKNGYQSWTASRALRAGERESVPVWSALVEMQDNPRNLASGLPGDFAADMVGMLSADGCGQALLVGQTAPFAQLFCLRTVPRLDGLPALDLVWDFDGALLPSGERRDLDPVVLMAGRHPARLLESYAGVVSPGRILDRPAPTGWCSWYHYYTKVSAVAIARNLSVAADRPTGWSHFILDDGWQTVVGDWLSVNGKFPDGLQPVADSIDRAGLAPGLWLAPFAALRRSRLAVEHPEWLLRRPDGRPVRAGWNPLWGLRGTYWALDTTHPGFRDHLNRVVRTMTAEWGFRLLKLDFLYAAALPGVARDRGLTPSERLQLGLDDIRQAAGRDVLLLGCGCPLAPAIGRVDAMRIGPDVAPFWSAPARNLLTRDPHALCTRSAIRSTLVRAPFHRRLWLNDPDCLLLRGRHTRLSPDERRSLADAIAVSGGMFLVSDDLDLLGLSEWDELARARRVAAECDRGRAWPLDLMSGEFPRLVWNSAGYLAVFNPAGRTVRDSHDLTRMAEGVIPADALFEDVRQGGRVRLAGLRFDPGPLRPHASRLFRLLAEG